MTDGDRCGRRPFGFEIRSAQTLARAAAAPPRAVWELSRGFDGLALGRVEAEFIAGNTAVLSLALTDPRYEAEVVARLLRHLFDDLGLAHVEVAGEGVEANAWRARHAQRPTLLVVAAALIDDDGRILMCQRPMGRAMEGLWEFPGGKIEAGETPEAALVRELREELGIDAFESCLAPLGFASHDYDSIHLLMPLFALRRWRGVVTAREGQVLRWVRPDRLGGLAMPPADIPLAATVRDWI